jgi:hypothetical protein
LHGGKVLTQIEYLLHCLQDGRTALQMASQHPDIVTLLRDALGSKATTDGEALISVFLNLEGADT